MSGTQSKNGRKLPNFLIIGAARSGTTSLYNYLRVHPSIFMPNVKEPGFFLGGATWKLGWGWYTGLFRKAGTEAVALGEASTGYSMFPSHPGVPERIASHLPDAKFIYCVRHPIERMRSQYLHRAAIGKESRPISQALLEDPIYVESSSYHMQLQQYLPHFPAERFLIVDTRKLKQDRKAQLSRIYEFLEVDPDWTPPNIDVEFFKGVGGVAYPRIVARGLFMLNVLLPHPTVRQKSRSIAGKLFGRSLAGTEAEAVISDDVRAELEGMLKEDVGRLRAFMSDGFDGWEIA